MRIPDVRAKGKSSSQALSCHEVVKRCMCRPISGREGEKAEKPKQRIRK